MPQGGDCECGSVPAAAPVPWALPEKCSCSSAGEFSVCWEFFFWISCLNSSQAGFVVSQRDFYLQQEWLCVPAWPREVAMVTGQ